MSPLHLCLIVNISVVNWTKTTEAHALEEESRLAFLNGELLDIRVKMGGLQTNQWSVTEPD